MAINKNDFDVDFKDTIKVIFNETEGSDWYGEFKEKYKKFKEAVNEVENKKKSAQEEAIKLMLFIREKMKKDNCIVNYIVFLLKCLAFSLNIRIFASC